MPLDVTSTVKPDSSSPFLRYSPAFFSSSITSRRMDVLALACGHHTWGVAPAAITKLSGDRQGWASAPILALGTSRPGWPIPRVGHVDRPSGAAAPLYLHRAGPAAGRHRA